MPAGGLPPRLDQCLRLVQSEEVARRELLEEVGGMASELHYVGQFYTSNGISNEVAYVYLATGVVLGETHREPTELMESRLVPVDEALRMARKGGISDGPRALALLWCEPLSYPLQHTSQSPETTQKHWESLGDHNSEKKSGPCPTCKPCSDSYLSRAEDGAIIVSDREELPELHMHGRAVR